MNNSSHYSPSSQSSQYKKRKSINNLDSQQCNNSLESNANSSGKTSKSLNNFNNLTHGTPQNNKRLNKAKLLQQRTNETNDNDKSYKSLFDFKSLPIQSIHKYLLHHSLITKNLDDNNNNNNNNNNNSVVVVENDEEDGKNENEKDDKLQKRFLNNLRFESACFPITHNQIYNNQKLKKIQQNSRRISEEGKKKNKKRRTNNNDKKDKDKDKDDQVGDEEEDDYDEVEVDENEQVLMIMKSLNKTNEKIDKIEKNLMKDDDNEYKNCLNYFEDSIGSLRNRFVSWANFHWEDQRLKLIENHSNGNGSFNNEENISNHNENGKSSNVVKINGNDGGKNESNGDHDGGNFKFDENEIISEFVYAIKTRGNALRPGTQYL